MARPPEVYGRPPRPSPPNWRSLARGSPGLRSRLDPIPPLLLPRRRAASWTSVCAGRGFCFGRSGRRSSSPASTPPWATNRQHRAACRSPGRSALGQCFADGGDDFVGPEVHCRVGDGLAGTDQVHESGGAAFKHGERRSSSTHCVTPPPIQRPSSSRVAGSESRLVRPETM